MSSVPDERFIAFLEKLGYLDASSPGKLKGNTFTYPIEIIDTDLPAACKKPLDIDYVYTPPPTPVSILKIHSDYWNRNNVNVFIAVSDDNSYIINAREKPNEDNPLDNKCHKAN